MDTIKFDKMKQAIENSTDYCRLKSFQTEITSQFESQIAAVNAQIADLQSWASLEDPTALLSKIISLATSGIAIAEINLGVIMAQQIEVINALTSKLSSLESELRNSLSDGSTTDLNIYCSTKEGW